MMALTACGGSTANEYRTEPEPLRFPDCVVEMYGINGYYLEGRGPALTWNDGRARCFKAFMDTVIVQQERLSN